MIDGEQLKKDIADDMPTRLLVRQELLPKAVFLQEMEKR